MNGHEDDKSLSTDSGSHKRQPNDDVEKKAKRTNSSRDLNCPICQVEIDDAFISKCGHSFCFACIEEYLNSYRKCPVCYTVLSKFDIHPNILYNKLSQSKNNYTSSFSVHNFAENFKKEDMTQEEIQILLNCLITKKNKMKLKEQQLDKRILREFLETAKNNRIEAVNDLKKQISYLDADLQLIDKETITHNKVNNSATETSEESLKKLDFKRSLIKSHLADLELCYFGQNNDDPKKSPEHLTKFSNIISNCSRFTKIIPRATLQFGDHGKSSAIVSSIEFDRDCDYVATAGVTKKIKFFDFNQIMTSEIESHLPIQEMVSKFRISCLSWNCYIKNYLASSDYEGAVCIWDSIKGTSIRNFVEHKKRTWSVDFSKKDPTLLASGSDDWTVKIWSLNSPNSCATIHSEANICSVKFNPNDERFFAFGSADHNVHYYDTRQTKQAVRVFKGHGKSVSYLNFLNDHEFVTASTDSTLKLWDINDENPTLTFSGHCNEKNFVGLTTNNGYLACGSEDNSVYIYSKDLKSPLLSYKFTNSNGLSEYENDSSHDTFVSAVCWKPNSNILLAANSQGAIKVLEPLIS